MSMQRRDSQHSIRHDMTYRPSVNDIPSGANGRAEDLDLLQKSIQPLPAEVVAQIKSSVAILSLSGVVVELVKNALDGGSTKIEATIDFVRGSCTIEDNGLGIAPPEFREDGGLCKMYYTSRYPSRDAYFGRNGTFLASLAAMSLLIITSHHHEYRSHNTVTILHSKTISRQLPAPQHQAPTSLGHGTRVTVRNLFGNMPVRVKQRALAVEEKAEHDRFWDRIRKDIAGLLLGLIKPVSIRIRDSENRSSFVMNGQAGTSSSSLANSKSGKPRSPQFTHMLNVLTQASFISHDDWTTWVPVSASTPRISVKGAISLEPAPSKQVQFLSLGIQPLSPDSGHNLLYDEINRIFNLSSFGCVENDSDVDDVEKIRRQKDKRFKSDGYTRRQLNRPRKGIDRWPMFYLRVSLVESVTAMTHTDKYLDNETNLQAVIEVLNVMLTQWLSVHHFRPRKGRLKNGRASSASTSTSGSESQDRRNRQSLLGHSNACPETPTVLSPNIGTLELASRKRRRSTPSTSDKVPRQIFQQPFTDWSRIKSGKVGFYDSLWNPGKHGKIKTSSNAQELDQGASAASTSSPTFNVDPSTQGSSSETLAPNALLADREDARGRDEDNSPENAHDETTIWTDPTTKERYLVNARTGCVVLRAPTRSTLDSSMATTTRTLLDYNKPLRLCARQRPDTADGANTPWLNGFLQDWDNPVFKLAERPIPQAFLDESHHEHGGGQCTHHDCCHINIDKTFRDVSSLKSSRLSKHDLHKARIVAQVDKKFILVKMPNIPSTCSTEGELLVLIDQHAADERVRVESLLAELCTPVPPFKHVQYHSKLGHQSLIAYSPLAQPIQFSISAHECSLFQRHAARFAAWGILYDLNTTRNDKPNNKTDAIISVTTLPALISERCKSDPKLLLSLLRAEIWKLADTKQSSTATMPLDSITSDSSPVWLSRIGFCPQGLLDMLNSRACRSAIMFNDALTLGECEEMVRKLADCVFPFMCAHGRPSMVPLVDLGRSDVTKDDEMEWFGSRTGLVKEVGRRGEFADAWKAWRVGEGGK